MCRTEDGRAFRILNVIDEFARECIGCLVQRRINSFDVLEFLAKLFIFRGQPGFIRSDNGPEFIAEKLQSWLSSLDVRTLYIEPGSPWEHGYCESFNGRMRDEFLNGEIFYSLKEAQVLVEMWRREITYFFTQDNCAYRMAELINLVVDEQILLQFVPYAIPHTMFDRIAHMNLPNGEPLVKSLKYRPSRQTKLTKKYKSLNSDSKHLVLDVVNNKASLESDKVNKSYQKMRQKYLLARVRLALQAIEKVDSEIAPIHEGQRPVLTRLSLGNTRNGQSFHDFEWRSAYYDLLSPDTGRLPYSSLAIWKMEMRLIDERLILRELDFFDVSAFNIASTGLPGDGSFAWKFRLGITSQSILCDECQVAAMKLGFGKAWEIDGKFAPYFFIGPNLTSSLNDIGTTGSLSEIGAIVTLSDDYRMIINQSYSKFYNQDEQYLETFSVDQRFGSERTWDIRLGYKYQLACEYELSFSYY